MTTDLADQWWNETPDSVVGVPRDEKVLQRTGASASERIFGFTADETPGKRLTERVLGAGFDGYIPKPLDPRSLVPQIATFLKMLAPEPVPRHTAEAEESAPVPLAHARALVLDDVAENLEFLRSPLEPNGISIEAGKTIAEAFARLARRKPDIIISDLHLGGERGEDFYARVRAKAGLPWVPFVFSSSTMRRDADRLVARSAGADRVIVRPIDSARLLAEIEDCLALRKGP
jgi:two-component system cell cycle response regulator